MTFSQAITAGVPSLRRVAVAALVLMTAACGSGGGNGGGPTPPSSTPIRVTFPGVGALGIFDPAVTQDTTGRMWMSYSAVDSSANSIWGVGIRLGYTDDAGTVWNDAGSIHAFRDVTVRPGISVTSPEPAITQNSPGIWQSETSTVVYDPHASVPVGERWKMLWFQALVINNSAYFASYSWIALKTANTAAGLAAAPATKLFGGYLIKNDATSLTNTGAPIAGAPAIALNLINNNPELASCVFGEPSLLATSDALYLALDCNSLGNPLLPYIVMFRCASPCTMTNIASWSYLGRVTTPADATAINSSYKSLGAPALTTQGGRYYLITTPVVTSGDRYDGCRVYEFSNLATGTLARDQSGNLLPPVAQVTGLSGTHHGACAYHAALPNGILHSQLETTNPPQIFRIYQSRVGIP